MQMGRQEGRHTPKRHTQGYQLQLHKARASKLSRQTARPAKEPFVFLESGMELKMSMITYVLDIQYSYFMVTFLLEIV